MSNPSIRSVTCGYMWDTVAGDFWYFDCRRGNIVEQFGSTRFQQRERGWTCYTVFVLTYVCIGRDGFVWRNPKKRIIINDRRIRGVNVSSINETQFGASRLGQFLNTVDRRRTRAIVPRRVFT